MIDCIYVIALEETLSTKRQELIDRVGELNLKSEQLILFKAVNGFTPQVDFKWEKFAWKIKDSDNGWWNRDLKAGEVGCALSHLCVWKHAATQKYKKILILEEDFKPVDVLSLTLLEELDQLDWHLCYAGRNKVKPDIKSASANIAVPDYTYCTHAYLLSQAGVENLISHRFENKIMPVDEFLSATFCNHPREDLNFIWKDLKTWDKKKGFEKNYKRSLHVVAIDYGIKKNILRYFSDFNCKVTVVPCKTGAKDILKLKPNGIFLSNGPGDPAATGKYAIPTIQELIKKKLPLFGICLGHQILALALGAKTEKMKLGHRGANHPVKNLIEGNVEITSQNHGFEVVKKGMPKNIRVTHQSLFDNSIEGIELKNKPVFSVQYHPESNPGPQDSVYLFDKFVKSMKKNAKKKRY